MTIHPPYLQWFPRILEDELLYSILARFRERCGLPSYYPTAQVLFLNPVCDPNFKSYNALRPEVITRMNMSWSELIQKHTLVPIYAFFTNGSKREKIEACVNGHDTSQLTTCLPIPTADLHYVRYCPLCATEDRACYGEAIWHVSAQYLPACPWHGCLIQDSSLSIGAKTDRELVAAERIITNVEPSEAPAHIRDLSKYAYHTLTAEQPHQSTIAEIFRAFISYSDYASGGLGYKSDIQRLYHDLVSFYGDVPWSDPIALTKLLLGKRCAPLEVCMLGFFLDIPVNVLSTLPPCIPRETVLKQFILEDYKAGIPFLQIAKNRNVSRGQVKQIIKDNE